MKLQHFSTWALTAVIALAGVVGCDVGSTGSSENLVGLNVAGTYTGVSGARLVSVNSGAAVTSLTVSQNGDRLQVVDNLNFVYSGTLAANGAFSLHGSGPSGLGIEITGAISVSGTRGWMRGYWVEPSVTGAINGLATVPPQPAAATASSGGSSSGSSGGTSGTSGGTSTAGGSAATGTGGTSTGGTSTGGGSTSGGTSSGTGTGGGRTPPMPPPPPGF